MRPTIRRAAIGTAAGLSLLLAAPAIPAFAHPGNPDPGPHPNKGWHGPANQAEAAAFHALRKAIKGANDDYRAAVRKARDTFRNDPAVKSAHDAMVLARKTATDPTLIQTAIDAYNAAIVGPMATRQAAEDAAVAAWITTVDAAFQVYDATVSPADAAANDAYRTSVRAAKVQLKTDLAKANSDYKTATATAQKTLHDAVIAALATFKASSNDGAAKADFKKTVHDARVAFNGDGSVITARGVRKTARDAAHAAYKKSIDDARAVYKTATGHNPTRGLAGTVLPRVPEHS